MNQNTALGNSFKIPCRFVTMRFPFLQGDSAEQKSDDQMFITVCRIVSEILTCFSVPV